MNTATLSDLIHQQRQRMQELRDDVWFRFEIADVIGKELMFETSEHGQIVIGLY